MSGAALDFQPALLAMERRPPSPLPRALLHALLLLLGLLIAGSMIGRVDIVASAPGRLVPQTYVKIVQPAEAGIVSELLVREGDRVTAGQVLARLDTTVAAADLAIVRREIESRLRQTQRIDAELAGHTMTRVPGDPAAAFEEVRSQGDARRRAFDDSLAAERAALEEAREQLAAVRAQVVKLEQFLPIYREEETSLERLAAEGLVPRFQLSEKRRQRIEAEQDLSSQRRTVAALDARIAEGRARGARVTSDYRQRLLSERVETQAALERAREEIAKHEHRRSLSELRAPQDGVIKDVSTNTVGTVIEAGAVLMTLVPVQEELVAEILIRNEDVGFVREGQPAKIKLAAFPFQKYGTIDGTVVRISADATELREGEPVSPYRAVVKLGNQRLRGAAADWPLAPGMQVIAEVKQGDRTVMEYLLSPVRRTIGEAARER